MVVGFLLALGGEPKLPAFFSDHMVLQRQTTAPLWGWAAPGEHIVVAPEWRPASLETNADEEGYWRVYLDTPAERGPFLIRITAPGGVVTLRDVLVGEAWLASGQSNMEWTLGPGVGNGVEGWEEAVRTSHDPELRFFSVENAVARVCVAACIAVAARRSATCAEAGSRPSPRAPRPSAPRRTSSRVLCAASSTCPWV